MDPQHRIKTTHPDCHECQSIGAAAARTAAPGQSVVAGNTHPEDRGHGAVVQADQAPPPALLEVTTSALAALPADAPLPALAVELLELHAARFKYAGLRRDALSKAMRRAGYTGASADLRASQITVQVLGTPQAARDYPAMVARLRKRMAS